MCNIGDNTNDISTQLQNITQKNYLENLKHIFKDKLFYSIQQSAPTQEERYRTILKKIVSDAIKDAQLSSEETKELHIFIGSTSMGISVNEEYRKMFNKGTSSLAFKELGGGFIASYVEKLVGSNHKAMLFSTACTSSANALAYASKLIEHQKIKRALVIGLELFNQATYGGFSSLMLLSKNGIYRPFDKHSDGIILGEGCSAVVLDSKKRAENNFKYISSSNICDNYSETTSDPTGIPIFNTLHRCLKQSGLTLKDIDCIKAHATGSENNNSSEAKAISLLFNEYKTTTKVTSLKPILGHTLGACGTNEMILMFYAINKGFIPATFGFETPAEDVKFTPVLEHTACEKKATILFNYVAFGGNNCSIILSNKE